jgi:hypothetical protein
MRVGHRDEAGVGLFADQRVQARVVDMVTEKHQVARRDVRAHRACGVGQDQPRRAQRLQDLQRQEHRAGIAVFVVMLSRAEDRDADAFKRADMQVRVVARDADMREAGQVGVGNRHALHLMRDMAEAGAEDQPQGHGFGTGAGADLVGKGCGIGHRDRLWLAAERGFHTPAPPWDIW